MGGADSLKKHELAKMLTRAGLSKIQPTVYTRVIGVLLGAFPFLDLFLSRHSFTLFSGPLGYGPFICMYSLLPFWVIKHKFPTGVFAAILVVCSIGSFGALRGIIPFMDYVKVVGSLVIPYTYYWYLWLFLGENVIKAFKLYLKGAYFVSIVGLLVLVDSIFHFGIYEGINSVLRISRHPAEFGIRISGTLGEPTYFASTIAPAACFSIYNMFFSDSPIREKLREHDFIMGRIPTIVILSASLLTYSTIALAGMFLSVIFVLMMKRQFKTLLASLGAVLLLASIAMNNAEVNNRITGLLDLSSSMDDGSIEPDAHGSSVVLYNHAVITWENLKRNPLFGSGFATHPVATKEYSIFKGTTYDVISDMNAQDASSMLLRIASELGLFGIAMVALFLTRGFIVLRSTDPTLTILKLISSAFLVAIILNLLRQGNFILHGFPFFVFGYHFARKQFNSVKKS